ncbi:hypothetical protein GQ53DRAFT_820466 [Thozetella sp. PMI_491]|nr:hypothetical protein GQ53DRAFT_820466 [Thozetella sp. PMI_491]
MSSQESSAVSSKRSSFSSVDVPAPAFCRADTHASIVSAASTSTTSSTAGGTLVDVLCRDFPKPADQINVAEMISRPPQPHSLRYYVKNARDLEIPAESKEVQAKKFAEEKKKLLAASNKLNHLQPSRW